MYKRSKILQVNVLVNNTIIEGNWNIVSYSDISNAANVDDKRSKELAKKYCNVDIVDITYLLYIEQQIQTVYSNDSTFLNFTIYLSENKNKTMYLHFEVLGYISTTSFKRILQSCSPGFIHSSETKARVCTPFLKRFGSYYVILISQQLLLHLIMSKTSGQWK